MRKAFTLIEMSIVLVIIGMVIAAVTVGSNLVNQSKLRSVIAEFQTYKTAIEQFQLAYNYFPGDFPGGFNQWGASCGTNDVATATSCNGNANGNVDTQAEINHTWIHLSLANMINGNYTAPASLATDQTAGTTVPNSRYGSLGAGYLIRNVTMYVDYIGNAIEFGNCNNGVVCNASLTTALDAYGIDLKIDDGLAGYGYIITIRNGTSCTNKAYNSATAGVYNLSGTNATTIDCVMYLFLTNQQLQ